MLKSLARPDVFTLANGEKAPLPFSPAEYAARLARLRRIMAEHGVEAALLTSMHNVAYYSGFLYCAFGRPFACVVTPTRCVTVLANIDGGQPWRRSVDENVIYTDWRRDNFWRAVQSVTGPTRSIGIEGDHLTLQQSTRLAEFLGAPLAVDIAPAAASARMVKSAEEIALIRTGARIADLGGHAIRAAIRTGASEIEIAQAGRDAMETEIARAFLHSELRDIRVWFQSGINTDGAHNPVTVRRIERATSSASTPSR